MKSTIITAIGIIMFVSVGTAFADTSFAVGKRVQVITGPLNARTAADVSAKTYGVQPTGAFGVLHQGPISQGGYDWWFVDYDHGVDGWSAENFLTTSVNIEGTQAAAAASSQIDALYQLVKNLQLIVAELIAAKQKTQ